MTLDEAAPNSKAEYEKDRHSHSLPGGQSGPNKDGSTAPDGASALGNEIGAESDAQRERAQALREGDILPGQGISKQDVGFGQLNGYEKGMSDNPSMGQRDDMQSSKNESWQSDQPDLASIAKNSGGSANYNPTSDPDSVLSTGSRRPEDILDIAGRSAGTESGYGAYAGGITSDSGTNNVPDQ